MEALKEQEEINYRLRQYMDKIILAILDHNPSILEIKNWREYEKEKQQLPDISAHATGSKQHSDTVNESINIYIH